MTTLAQLPCGARAFVAGLPAQHGLARRLIALGLTPGAEVYVLQNRGRGPLIVEAHGARIALGRRQADRVTIDLGRVPSRLPGPTSGAALQCEGAESSSAEAGFGEVVSDEDPEEAPVEAVTSAAGK
jgi:Fe2+ transport system protein FeoA